MEREKNMTQLDAARKGIVTDEMRMVAESEHRDAEFIRDGIANGRIVLPANILHKSLRPMGIGRELKTKINANIGTALPAAASRWNSPNSTQQSNMVQTQ